ncbi:MAG: hypothetical protein MJ093_08255 [Saccharofermentans sp.]|nr:hypothetical protein [Saccharofermentans sp.]
MNYYREERIRKNQPTGNKPSRIITCEFHDYAYYPNDWTNKNGENFRAGYYDENGNWYENVIFKDAFNYTYELKCEYCGADIKAHWKEGAFPSCPSCGARLNVNTNTTPVDTVVRLRPTLSPQHKKFMAASFIVVGIIAISMPIVFFATSRNMVSTFNDHVKQQQEMLDDATPTLPDTDISIISEESQSDHIAFFGNSYMSSKLNRVLPWDSEIGGYYDEETGVYAFYNTEPFPFQWEFWNENLSDEYGWFMYNEDTSTWFCDNNTGTWTQVPDNLDTSEFWYIGRLET